VIAAQRSTSNLRTACRYADAAALCDAFVREVDALATKFKSSTARNTRANELLAARVVARWHALHALLSDVRADNDAAVIEHVTAIASAFGDNEASKKAKSTLAAMDDAAAMTALHIAVWPHVDTVRVSMCVVRIVLRMLTGGDRACVRRAAGP
jgi:hypothetical protein